MDDLRFDMLARALGRERTRRGFGRTLGAAVLAAAGLKSAADVAAQSTCIPSKQACQSTDQCCRGACVGNICDSTCSEVGPYCETDLDCCSGLSCKGTAADPSFRCRPTTCNPAGGACIDHFDCCAGTCSNSRCVAPEPSPSPTQPDGATPIAETPDPGSAAGEGGSRAATSLPATGVSPEKSHGFPLKIAGGLAVVAAAFGAATRLVRSRASSREF